LHDEEISSELADITGISDFLDAIADKFFLAGTLTLLTQTPLLPPCTSSTDVGW